MGKEQNQDLSPKRLERKAYPTALPPLVSRLKRQNLTAIKISFKTHGLAVFSLNNRGRRLIGYSSDPHSPKGSQGVAIVYISSNPFNSSTQGAVTPCGSYPLTGG